MRTVLSVAWVSLLLSCEEQAHEGEGAEVAVARAALNVGSCAQLQAISRNLAGSYRLTADIDCTGFDAGDGYGFDPLGHRDDVRFTGYFDGDGHAITGLTIDRPWRPSVALFGATDGAVIERVGLVNASVEGGQAVGTLVGIAFDTTIRESYATGVVSGYTDVGGLAGELDPMSTMHDCYATPTIVADNDHGLLVGWVAGTIERSYGVGTAPARLGAIHDGSIETSFYDCNFGGDCSEVGASSTASMTSQSHYLSAGWDFDATWGFLGPNGYPCLQWQDGCGCLAGNDGDGDGVDDCSDGCLADPEKSAPGLCGCGQPDTDSDTDGVIDCEDPCPFDPAKLEPGICGCNEPDVDEDGDGLLNCNDPDWSRAIRNCAELQAIRDDLAGSYRLVVDVDCTGFDAGDGEGFEPLGHRDETRFTGHFDGNGHVITGLASMRPYRTSVGLFGATDGAVIERVGLVNASMYGAQAVGTLVGIAFGTTVRQSFASGLIAGTTDVGGLVGELDSNSTVQDCYAEVGVAADHDHGLLVGWINGTIERSYSAGAAPARLGAVYDGSIASSFYDCDVAGDCSELGATSTLNMGIESTYSGWDFSNVWDMSPAGYPCLRWHDECHCVPGRDYDGDGASDCADSNVLGYWNFDEASGAALDSSGNAAHGSLVNATRDANGRLGSAVYFNGTSSRVSIPDDAWNVGTPVTYTAWYKADGIPKGMVFEHRHTSVVTGSFAFHPLAFSGATYDHVRFAAYDSTGTGRGNTFPGVTPPGQWAMVTVVISASEMKVFKNGRPLGTTSITGGLPAIPGPLYIGARGEVPDNFFKGWIDEFAVYGRALSDTEVEELYESYGDTPSPPWNGTGGLVGRWSFDEGSGTTVTDSSGLGNTGTLQGGTTWDSSCISGSCLRFNGTNATVRVPDGLWNQATPGTFVLWYKMDTAPTGMFLMEHMLGANNPGAFVLRANAPGYSAYETRTVSRSATGWTTPATGVWRMLAVTTTPTELKLYRDGTLVSTTAMNGGPPYIPGDLWFGARGSESDNYFKGWIDEVSIYARALSGAQIQDLFNETLGRTACDSNDDCDPRFVCAYGIGDRFGRAAHEGTCWDPVQCATLHSEHCGTPLSRCGSDCCIPDCSGDRTEDGCGNACAPCVQNADSDGDGLNDCEERGDDDAWTDALVFNGVEAQRGDSCHPVPTCAAIDTFEEIDACFQRVEDSVLRAGWDFDSTARDICDSAYGYELGWHDCGTDFAVHYSAMLRLEESGTHCFHASAGVQNECAALYFADQATLTPETGVACFEVSAGIYPIEWFYETTSTATSSLHILHCFGGADTCSPVAPIDSNDLRRPSDAEQRVCGSSEACSELCPCPVGSPVPDPLHCESGLVVRTDVAESFELEPNTPVCWDPLCDDRASGFFECGFSGARCGTVCPSCPQQCGGKGCGYDGCWGQCADGVCGEGEAGCESDADCASGLACILDSQGGLNTCRPTHCLSPAINPCADPANAGQTTDCGVTCPICVQSCDGKNCGDNGCGGSCGPTEPDEYCSPEGQREPQPNVQFDREPPVDGDVTAGTLPGDVAVNESGQATYAIPLQLPPGRNGIEPRLALTYNSGGGNGYLGMGWSLSGLSAVQRCAKTIAQDGEVGGITYTESDRFCLDGQRLVTETDNATYGADGTHYRTEIDTFARVESKGGANGEPEWFEVRTHDGKIMKYRQRVAGNTPLTGHGVRKPDYVESAPEDARTHTWALTEVSDRIGNTMTIDYFVPRQCLPDDGTALTESLNVKCDPIIGGGVREYYPNSIRYTSASNADIALNSDRMVLFQYRPRSEVLAGYHYGVRFERTQLLDAIVATVWGRTAFSYKLEYENEPLTSASGAVVSADLHKRTLLRSVKQCARASVSGNLAGPLSTCMPPTIFEYEEVVPGFEEAELTAGVPDVSESNTGILGRPITLDLDGNGQDDVLYPDCVTFSQGVCTRPGWRLILNGNFKSETLPRMVVMGGRAINPAEAFAVDLDLDGKDEVLEIDTALRRGTDGSAARVWRLRPNETFQITNVATGLESVRALSVKLYVFDADGDGATDLVQCAKKNEQSARWTRRRGNRSGGFAAEELIRENGPLCFGATPIDLNGDGAGELLLNATNVRTMYPSTRGEARVTTHTTDAFWPLTGAVTAGVLPAKQAEVVRITLDANGDGLSDVVEFGTRRNTRVWTNVGTGFKSGNWSSLAFSGTGLYDDATFLRQLPRYATPFDENGDGRSDLIVRAGVGRFVALRARGETFDVIALPSGINQDDGNQFAVYDADQDGLADLLEQRQLWKRSGSSAPRLVVATNGLGARTAVVYGELSRDEPENDGEPRLYAHDPDLDGCTDPCFPQHPRGTAVRRTLHWTTPYVGEPPPAPTRSVRYGYYGGAVALNGRGSLGFGGVTIVDEAREAIAKVSSEEHGGQATIIKYGSTIYDSETQIYPFAGRVVAQTDGTSFGPSDAPRIRERAVERVPFIEHPTDRSVFPYIRSETNVVKERDVSGSSATLHDSETEWTYDDYGNVLRKSITFAEADGIIIDHTTLTAIYRTDGVYLDEWLVGLPSLQTTTSRRGWEPAQQRHQMFYYFEDESCPVEGPAFSGLLCQVSQDEGSATQLDTTYVYSAVGLPTQITSTGNTVDGPQTRGSAIAYDDRQMFPISVTDSQGHVLEVQYDSALGVPLITKEQLRDDAAPITRTTYPDGFGRPRLVTGADGVPTTITYELQSASMGGFASTQIRVGAPATRDEYDVLGRPTKKVEDSLESSLTTTIEYTPMGLPWKTSRPHRDVSTVSPDHVVTTYDALGRPLTVALADNSVTEHCYRDNVTCKRTARGYTSCAVTDEHGTLLYSVDPLEEPEACQDAVNAVAAEFPHELFSTSTGSRTATRYQYGAFDTTIALLDSRGAQTSISYDNYGRATSQVDPSRGAWEWTHNSFGEVQTEINGKGQKAVLRYDLLGRQTSRAEVDGSDAVIEETTFGYDDNGILPGARGQLASTTSPDGVWQLIGYDDYGRPSILQTTIPAGENTFELLTRRTDYDAFGRSSTVTYESAVAPEEPIRIRKQYNERGFVDRVYRTDDADPNASFDAAADEEYWRADHEDAYGQLREETYGNGVVTRRTFLPGSGRLATLSSVHGATSVISRAYGYYPDGNLETQDDVNALVGTSYEYDELNRLRIARTSGIVDVIREEGFDYDIAGNLDYRYVIDDLEMTLREYEYFDASRPDQLSSVVEAENQIRGYTYDGNGNVEFSNHPVTGLSLVMTYNARVMPQSTVAFLGATVTASSYGYDAFSQRASKRTVSASTEERTFYLDEAYQRTAVGGTSGAQERVVIFAGGSAIADLVRNPDGSEEMHYLHEDHLGSIAAISDDSGTLVVQRDYEPFGKRRATEPVAYNSTRRDFTGHEYDPEFGLVNMRARLYDPEIGRFLQADTIIAMPGWSQGLNAYSYGYNNPILNTDPSGHVADCVAGCPVTAAVIGVGVTVAAVGLIANAIDSGKIDLDEFGNDVEDFFEGIGELFDDNDLPSVSVARTVSAAAEVSTSVGPQASSLMSDIWSGVKDAVDAYDRFATGLNELNEALTPDFIEYTNPLFLSGANHLPTSNELVLDLAVRAVTKVPASKLLKVLKGARTFCFAEGTLVHMADELVPIEDVKIGDLVWSREEHSGKIALREVVQTFVTPDQELLEVVLEGTTVRDVLSVTGEHPFWTRSGWIAAKDLGVGDEIQQRSGGWLRVRKAVWKGERATVYNFEVAEFHTYFVGNTGAWVHNSCVDEARKIADSISSSLKCFGKCQPFADELVSGLKARGVSGTILDVKTPTATVISSELNGGQMVGYQVHRAVRVGDTVFDNLNSAGVDYNVWRQNLVYLEGGFKPVPDSFITPTAF